jgi:hypothetical protein
MGCRSYAEFSIRHNLAGLSEVVSTFLHDMSCIVRPKADEVLVSCTYFFLYLMKLLLSSYLVLNSLIS